MCGQVQEEACKIVSVILLTTLFGSKKRKQGPSQTPVLYIGFGPFVFFYIGF